MRKWKLLRKVLANAENVRFGDMVTLAEAFGFEKSRVSGSHHIFKHPIDDRTHQSAGLQGKGQSLPNSTVSEIARAVRFGQGGPTVKDYHINVFYSESDDCYVADVPDLRFCSAFGSSPQKALLEVIRAKRAWLKAAEREGKPIPPPRFQPSIYRVKSRK